MNGVRLALMAAMAVGGCATGGGSFEWKEATWSGVGSLVTTSYGCQLNLAVINTTSQPRNYFFMATAYDKDGNTVAGSSGGTPQIDPGKRGTTWMTFTASCFRIEKMRLTLR